LTRDELSFAVRRMRSTLKALGSMVTHCERLTARPEGDVGKLSEWRAQVDARLADHWAALADANLV
jgi:hypothetical protein